MFLHTVCLDKYFEAIFRPFKDIKTVDILDIKTFDILKCDLLGSLSCLTHHQGSLFQFVLPIVEWVTRVGCWWCQEEIGRQEIGEKDVTWSCTAHCTPAAWSAARLVSAHQQTSSGVQLTSVLADQLANLNPASFCLERRHNVAVGRLKNRIYTLALSLLSFQLTRLGLFLRKANLCTQQKRCHIASKLYSQQISLLEQLHTPTWAFESPFISISEFHILLCFENGDRSP